MTVEAPAAIAAIAAIGGSEAMVGAGSFTSVELAREAVMAGAQFLGTPHLDEVIVGSPLRQELIRSPIEPESWSAPSAELGASQLGARNLADEETSVANK